ncbi:hypothetical protein N7486_004263 [Penicillium sp. IBT 16267x]|nr:hypothetical protein N7486_004263 [Penicillium sp. IBT 16267x]
MFRLLRLNTFLTCLLGVATAAPTAQDPVIDLGYARYRGLYNESLGIITYHGLHYAEPPTGNLRWRAPVAIDKSKSIANGHGKKTIIDATSYGPECVQTAPQWSLNGATYTPAGEEDCLLLDVIVPAKPRSSSLPVIIQIHGGGYVQGDSATEDGSQLVSFSDGQVIYVQIQYRLGPYGFLSSEEVKSDGAANAGLLDQRSAIEWVQRNVARFGGDPAKVTIWGGSAGGGSVTCQLIYEGGARNPPFRAAIAQRPWMQPFHGNDVLEAQYADLLTVTNCQTLQCLRELSPSALATASQALYVMGYQEKRYGYGDFYFGPSVDGKIIQDLPSVEFSKGHFSKVALLTDREGYEGYIFSNMSITTEPEVQSDLLTLWPQANEAFIQELLKIYPQSDYKGAQSLPSSAETAEPQLIGDSAFGQISQLFGEYIIDCPTTHMAEAVEAIQMPVYKLDFNAGSQTHGATIPYLFDAADATSNSTLASYMKSWYLSFAVALDPNADIVGSTPRWASYPSVLYATDNSLKTIMDPDVTKGCDFFLSNPYVVRN